VINPAPVVVYDFISPDLLEDADLVWKRKFNTALPFSGLDILANAPDQHAFSTGRILYFNWGTNFSSCATTICKLLGADWQTPTTDDPLDPTKFGMRLPDLLFILRQVATHDVQITTIDCKLGDLAPAELIMLCSQVEHSLTIRCSLHIIVSVDHVLFTVSAEFKSRSYEHFCLIANPPEITKETIRDLTTRYPPNSGRAGGKVFMNWQTISRSVATDNYARAIVPLLLRNSNDWELVASIAVPLLAWVAVSGRDLISFFIQNEWIFSLDFPVYVKVCKNVHTFTRMTGRLPGFTRCNNNLTAQRSWSNSIYGLDIIGGRSELLKFDSHGEMIMRMADPALRAVPVLNESGTLRMDRAEYRRLHAAATKMVVRDLILPEVSASTLHNWYSRRMYWGASGGAPGASVTWADSNEKLRLNKRGALLAIPVSTIHRVLKQADTAVQWSVNALKFESAKMRGILNTSVENYVIQAYIMDIFDKNVRGNTWYSTSHDNPTRVANMIRRIVDLRGRHALMWDFADFNINHIFTAVAELFLEVGSTLCDRVSNLNFSPTVLALIKQDIAKCTQFMVNARLNTYLSDGAASPFIIKAVRSLQSGERATSFTNCMMSEIDFQIVKEVGKALFGFDLLPHRGDKLGDDVFANPLNMLAAVLVCCLYNLTGAAGQLYKITNDYAQARPARGEFLRYAYDAATPAVTGYPIRAMMGVIHGEFFSEPIPKPVERAATFVEQFAKLRRRGWAPPNTLLLDVINDNCSISYMTGSATKPKQHVKPELALAVLPAILGGVGITHTLDEKSPLVTDTINDSFSYTRVVRMGAIIIPSGEGKTTLACLYSDLFADHESMIDINSLNTLKAKAAEQGNWAPVNRYLRDCVTADKLGNRILLTWGVSTTPDFIKDKVAYMLIAGSSLRANKANRADIVKSGVQVSYYESHSELVAASFLYAVAHLENRGTGFYKTFKCDPNHTRPNFTWPRIPASEMLRQAKTHIGDYDAIRRFGHPELITSVDRAALESGMTGAYKKDALYERVAIYAKTLDLWQKSGHWEDVSVQLVLPDSLTSAEFFNSMTMSIHQTLGLTLSGGDLGIAMEDVFIRNNEGYPTAKSVIHNYNCLSRILPKLGISLDSTLRELINHSLPLRGSCGRLGKLLGLLDQANRSEASYDSDVTVKPHTSLAFLINFLMKVAPWDRTPQADYIAACDNCYDYITGGLDLFPPFNPGLSVEVISLIRDLTLRSIEERQILQLLIKHTKLEIAHYVRTYEREVLIIFIGIINRRFNGLILHD
jgi:hypothetical protein